MDGIIEGGLSIAPMDIEAARDIALWRYGGAYAIYDFDGSDALLSEFMNGDYYAARDDARALAVYFCYGLSARVPADDPEIYAADATDIGLGMAPPLCGRGMGTDFVRQGLVFGYKTFGKSLLRLTVASFNSRAITVYERAGFVRRHTFERCSAHGTTMFQTMLLNLI